MKKLVSCTPAREAAGGAKVFKASNDGLKSRHTPAMRARVRRGGVTDLQRHLLPPPRAPRARLRPQGNCTNFGSFAAPPRAPRARLRLHKILWVCHSLSHTPRAAREAATDGQRVGPTLTQC
jgi:hypothetical protein